MTKKDYELIADALSEAYSESPEWQHMRAVYVAIERVASALERDNPNFKRGRFLSAATGGVGTRT
jgi:hypothetical protein